MTERYFEDFAVGQVFKPTGRVRIEKEDIIAFAQKFDPQPFHLDEEAARHSMFGRLVASGWHTAAVTMSLIARSEDRAAGGTIGLGFESLRWPIPVLPGDELRIESEVLEVRPARHHAVGHDLLHDLAILIERLRAHFQKSTVWPRPRRPHLEYFAFDA